MGFIWDRTKTQYICHLKWKCKNNLHTLKTHAFPRELETREAFGLSGMVFEDLHQPCLRSYQTRQYLGKLCSRRISMHILTKHCTTLPKSINEQLLPETSYSKIIPGSHPFPHHWFRTTSAFIFLKASW